ncbi:MAG: outer membrane protein transport protein [candidate division Zixibacteria bacterium]|nr:outer membrane protein transport protein [candidate division Zixibacteria bacterium]
MRRVKVTLLLCALFALFLSIPAWGGGMGTFGVGAKAKAMGGTFRAIADDWSAAYYNPAGLFYVTENELTVNEIITNYQLKYSPTVKNGAYPIGFYSGEIRNRYETITNPNFGGYFKLPVGGNDVILGFTIFQPFDMNLSWELFSPLNNSASLPGQQLEHNFDGVAINAVAAVELIENKLSFGISTGVLKADLNYGGFFLRQNPADPTADYYDVVASRPNDLITEWQMSDGNGLGFNLRAGFLLKPTTKLSFGVSYAIKSTIKIDGKTDFYYYMPEITYNSGLIFTDSEDYILSSGAVYEARGDFETEVTMPSQIAAGIAYQLSEKLLIAGDIEYTLWSDFKGYAFDYTFSDSNITRNARINSWAVEDLSVPVDWDNTIRGSVGLEYAYSDKLILRGGYSADQTPVKQGTLHPAFFDSGLKHAANFGIGLVFENVKLDFATQYIMYPESTESGNTYLEDANGITDNSFDNMSGTYSGSAFESVVQFTVRF